MKVADAVTELSEASDQGVELHEAGLSGNFWRGIACSALKALRGVIHMDAEQSAAWQVVESLICGG